MMTTKTPQKHTGNDLWSLEILIGMNVAGRNSKVESYCQQQEVSASPHDHCPSQIEIRHKEEKQRLGENYTAQKGKMRKFKIMDRKVGLEKCDA